MYTKKILKSKLLYIPWKSSAKELRSSVESVNIEDVLLLLEDKKAEAALRSSSKSETVRRELPIDLVAEAEQFDICIVDNQSSTVPPTDE